MSLLSIDIHTHEAMLCTAVHNKLGCCRSEELPIERQPWWYDQASAELAEAVRAMFRPMLRAATAIILVQWVVLCLLTLSLCLLGWYWGVALCLAINMVGACLDAELCAMLLARQVSSETAFRFVLLVFLPVAGIAMSAMDIAVVFALLQSWSDDARKLVRRHHRMRELVEEALPFYAKVTVGTNLLRWSLVPLGIDAARILLFAQPSMQSVGVPMAVVVLLWARRIEAATAGPARCCKNGRERGGTISIAGFPQVVTSLVRIWPQVAT
jgi:hypothetical protein